MTIPLGHQSALMMNKGSEGVNTGSESESGRPRNPRPAKRVRQVDDLATVSSRALARTNSSEYLHNLQYSGLHQLPEELILQINDRLSHYPDAILALRLVSRDFYRIFELPFIVEPLFRNRFKAALRRDNISWYSRWERYKGLPNLPSATCSACGSRHSKSQFLPQELARNPEDRICIGAKETLSMGDGSTATLNEILDRGSPLEHLGTALQQVYVCKSFVTTKSRVHTPFLESTIVHMLNAQNLVVVRHFRLLPLPKQELSAEETRAQSRSALETFVCPFIQSHKLRFKDCLMNFQPPKSKVPRYLVHITKLYRSYNFTRFPNWCRCPADSDPSVVSLHRRQSEFDEGMHDVISSVFEVYRPPSESADPAWADVVIRRLVDEHNELNGKLHEQVDTVEYTAKGIGQWACLKPARSIHL